MLGTTVVPDHLRPKLSQGCKPGSLYSDAAFGAPNASSFAFVYAAKGIGLGLVPDPVLGFAPVTLIDRGLDPYAGIQQSRNLRSEEHTSELQSLMRISYAVFCLKKKIKTYT